MYSYRSCLSSFGVGVFCQEKFYTGIVENVRIYMIEGNSKDEVRAKSYSLDYECILGYEIIKVDIILYITTFKNF